MPLEVRTFHVFGNYGTIKASADSGKVLRLDERHSDADQAANYRDILFFGVAEWRNRYATTQLEGTWVDIIDIGFWYGPRANYAAPPR